MCNNILHMSRFQKVAVVCVFAAGLLYFLPLLYGALSVQSLGEGWKNIKSNVWALSALIDYVTWVRFVCYMILVLISLLLVD